MARDYLLVFTNFTNLNLEYTKKKETIQQQYVVDDKFVDFLFARYSNKKQ